MLQRRALAKRWILCVSSCLLVAAPLWVAAPAKADKVVGGLLSLRHELNWVVDRVDLRISACRPSFRAGSKARSPRGPPRSTAGSR